MKTWEELEKEMRKQFPNASDEAIRDLVEAYFDDHAEEQQNAKL